MNTKLITAWNNLQSIIQTHLDNYEVTSDIIDDKKLKELIKIYWDFSFTEIINKNKIDFTFNDLLNEIRKLTEQLSLLRL